MDDRVAHNSLSKEQKTGFVLLFVFGLIAVGLGFLQVRNTIFSPFVIRLSEEKVNTDRFFQNETTRLQQIDTDQDGFTDYEELTFYQTSPYLPDTDSDGIPDKKEITDGTNPLCPEGETCIEEQVAKATPDVGLGFLAGTTTLDAIGTIGQSLQSVSGASAAVSPVELQKIIADPKALRELLRRHGSLTEEQIQSIDDKTLLNIAAQILPTIGIESLVESAPTSTKRQ